MLTVPDPPAGCAVLPGGFVLVVRVADEPLARVAQLAAAGITDVPDGSAAWRAEREPELGTVLGPSADHLVLIAEVTVIAVSGTLARRVVAVIIAREVIGAIGTAVLAARGARPRGVTAIARAGGGGLMVCFACLVSGHRSGTVDGAVRAALTARPVPSLVGSVTVAGAGTRGVSRARDGLRAQGVMYLTLRAGAPRGVGREDRREATTRPGGDPGRAADRKGRPVRRVRRQAA